MIFKNKRGFDAMGILVSAVLVVAVILLIIWAVFPKIKGGANAATNPAENSCEILADGSCDTPVTSTESGCGPGTSKITVAVCANKTRICCTKPPSSSCAAVSGACVASIAGAANNGCGEGKTRITAVCDNNRICCKTN